MPQFILTITLQEDGNVQVSGPIDNKILTYGLLAIAQETVSEFHKDRQCRVTLASPDSIPPPLGGAN